MTRLTVRRIAFAASLLIVLLSAGGRSVWAQDPTPTEPASGSARDHGLGCIPSRPGRYDLVRPPVGTGQLPSFVDLSGSLPPAGDQGMQNSCVGWAVAYGYKTFQEGQEQAWDLSDPDHQFSSSYVYNQRTTADCTRDSGMSVPDGMTILVQQGCAPFSVFPYTGGDPCVIPDESQRAIAGQYKTRSFGLLFIGPGTANLSVLKGHLAQGDAFVLTFPVYPNFYESSCEDLVIGEPEQAEMFLGGHAVLVVGYDDAIGGFKFLNSYGLDWMCDGLAYLSYSFVQRYAWEGWIMEDAVGPVLATPTPGPVSAHTTTPTLTATSTATLTPTHTSTAVASATLTASTTPSATPLPTATPTARMEPTPSPTPAPMPRSDGWCPVALMMPMTMLVVRGLGGRCRRRDPTR
jgi:hypothetical protein